MSETYLARDEKTGLHWVIQRGEDVVGTVDAESRLVRPSLDMRSLPELANAILTAKGADELLKAIGTLPPIENASYSERLTALCDAKALQEECSFYPLMSPEGGSGEPSFYNPIPYKGTCSLASCKRAVEKWSLEPYQLDSLLSSGEYYSAEPLQDWLALRALLTVGAQALAHASRAGKCWPDRWQPSLSQHFFLGVDATRSSVLLLREANVSGASWKERLLQDADRLDVEYLYELSATPISVLTTATCNLGDIWPSLLLRQMMKLGAIGDSGSSAPAEGGIVSSWLLPDEGYGQSALLDLSVPVSIDGSSEAPRLFRHCLLFVFEERPVKSMGTENYDPLFSCMNTLSMARWADGCRHIASDVDELFSLRLFQFGPRFMRSDLISIDQDGNAYGEEVSTDTPQALWQCIKQHPGYRLIACKHCSRTFLTEKRGKPREFCSNTCRVAHQKKDRLATQGDSQTH